MFFGEDLEWIARYRHPRSTDLDLLGLIFIKNHFDIKFFVILRNQTKFMNRLFFLNIFFIGVFVEMFGQSTLKGKVVDEFYEPLFNVNVVIDASKGWASVTDFDGNYKIEVPEGNYSVLYKYMGKDNVTKEIVLKNNEELILDVVLKGKEMQLGPIVIGASKRGKPIEEEIISVEVLTSEFLNSNNITNGADAIDRVSGITILDGQASIRGGSGYAYGAGSRVILVIDEIPLLSPERSEVLWDFIPMENLDQMEVVKGAASVQYGSSALNGIVNVATKWPTKKKETQISLFAGIYDNPPIEEGKWWTYSTEGWRQNPHDVGFLVNHMRKLNDEMDLVIGGTMQSNQTHIRNQSVSKIRNTIKWRFRPKKIEGLNIGVHSNVYYRNLDQFFIWDGFGQGSYTGASFQDKYIRLSVDPYIKYYWGNNSLKLLNRVYYDKRIGRPYNSTSVYNDLQYQKEMNGSNLSGAITSGIVNNSSSIKAISFRESSRDGSSTFSVNSYAAYFQGEMKWKDLTMASGVRFDFIGIDGETQATKPVFNGGLNYKFLKNNYLRFSGGQSFRVPGIAERFVDESIADSPPILVGPNENIQPESGYSIEIGYKKVFHINSWKLSADLAVFYQDYENMVEFVFGNWEHDNFPDSSYLGFRSVNIADAKIFGWEININGNGKIGKVPITFQAGYTYNYGANAAENPELARFGDVFRNAFKAYSISNEEQLSYDSSRPRGNILHGMLRYRFRHTLKMDIAADFNKFNIGVNVRYYSYIDRVDEIFRIFIPGINSYRAEKEFRGDFVFDLRGFYNFNEKYSVGLIVKNLFNRDYQIRPAKPDPPRSFTLQARINF